MLDAPQRRTLAVVLLTAAWLVAYDLWTYRRHGGGSTISWVTATCCARYPVLALACGVLAGHFFIVPWASGLLARRNLAAPAAALAGFAAGGLFWRQRPAAAGPPPPEPDPMLTPATPPPDPEQGPAPDKSSADVFAEVLAGAFTNPFTNDPHSGGAGLKGTDPAPAPAGTANAVQLGKALMLTALTAAALAGLNELAAHAADIGHLFPGPWGPVAFAALAGLAKIGLAMLRRDPNAPTNPPGT
jgi:hypothetical protein